MLKYWIVLICCCSAWAVPPELGGLSPLGAQRGVETGLGLYGNNLDYDVKIITPIRGKFEAQVPASRPAGAINPILLKVKVDADMPNGIYPISVYRESGISNRILFGVGDWPTIAEDESKPNDNLATAQVITPPVIVGGTLTAADRDYYKFSGKSGQRLVLETESSRFNMPVDTAIELLDGQGQQLQANDDAQGLGTDSRIDALLPRDGDYYVVVHDAKFGAPAPNQYRLKVGQTVYADAIFPLGGSRDGDFAVQLVGGNLEKPTEGKRLPVGSPLAPWTLVAFRPGESAALPIKYAFSEGRELVEPATGGAMTLEAGTVVNGRISRPGEVDLYALNVSPGQKWLFEVDAAILGSSRLDGILTVSDENNKRLAVADDGSSVINIVAMKDSNGNQLPAPPFSSLDPKLAFDVPAGIRRVFLSVEDLHGRGGPEYGYRLSAKIREPDYSLRILDDRVNIPREGSAVVRVAVDRIDYAGPIQLHILENIDGLTADGGLIPENSGEGVLTLSALGNAPMRSFDLPIAGYFGPAALPQERRALAVSTPSPSSPQIDLPAAIMPRLPVSMMPKQRTVVVPHGHAVTVPFSVRRDEGAIGAIPMRVQSTTLITGPDGLPIAISATVAEKAAEGVVTFAAGGDEPLTRLATYSVVLSGTIKDQGRDVEVIVPPIAYEAVRPFTARIFSSGPKIYPGDVFKLEGLVERVPPFAGAVKVRIDGLPAGVSVEPVTVAPTESIFQIIVKTDVKIEPAVVPLAIVASTPMGGRRTTVDYELPPVRAQFEVVARPPATAPTSAAAPPTAK